MIKRLLPPCALLGAVLLSLAVHDAVVESRPFLTTSSPAGTYTVNLTGRKERPFIFTNEVNYRVLKAGETFLPSTLLHSAGDFLDLSFEAGYPDSRWVNEGTLQFYRQQYFDDGKPDTLTVINETDQAVKYLEVHSVDKLLLFDLQPGAATTLSTPRPRGDYKSLYVRGEFSDGRRIERGWAALEPVSKLPGPGTYYVYVGGGGVTVEGPRLEKSKEAE